MKQERTGISKRGKDERRGETKGEAGKYCVSARPVFFFICSLIIKKDMGNNGNVVVFTIYFACFILYILLDRILRGS